MTSTKTVIINGLSIRYKEAGSGAPLLLLHGWGCDLNIFEKVQDFLKNHFTTYAIDLPGFGESQTPTEVWGIEKYTQCIEAFIQQLNIVNPILLGHSFGGRISILLSSRQQVKKVILVDSAGIKPTRTLLYYVKVYSYKFVKFLAQLPLLSNLLNPLLESYRKKVGSSDYQQASDRMRQILVKVVNEDLQHVMPKIKASTLLIWGENDTATPVRDAKIMEQKIPDAGLVVLKGSGHYSFLEQLNQFLIIVDHFLKPEVESR